MHVDCVPFWIESDDFVRNRVLKNVNCMEPNSRGDEVGGRIL